MVDSRLIYNTFSPDAAWPADGGAYGNGAFGAWELDAEGVPCYRYDSPETVEDHWHMLGNDRLTATAHNGGYVQLWDWSRVLKTVNKLDGGNLNLAGGFKILGINGHRTVTVLDALPREAQLRLLFGMGYFEKECVVDGVRVSERYSIPQGDALVLISETTLTNETKTALDVDVIEYWGCNVHQIAPAVIMTGKFGRFFSKWREGFNKRQALVSTWDAANAVLSVAHQWNSWMPQWPKTWRGLWDRHYPALFLAALDDMPADFSAYATDADVLWRSSTLGGAIPRHESLSGQLAPTRSARGGRTMLAIERRVSLAPGASATVRYAYGIGEKEQVPALVESLRAPKPAEAYPTVSMWTPGAEWMNRELTWHSYYLAAHAYYSDFFRAHFVDQGSAYSYVHGAISVPRDMSQYILALTWFRPDLAKECLRFQMRSQNPRTGKFPYCACAYGFTTGFGIHSFSSDLDMFFLWGLAEYIAATGDYDFLHETIAYYPYREGQHPSLCARLWHLLTGWRGAPAPVAEGTVLEHARASFRHLAASVGVGKHGLLRSMTGDWNDVLMVFAPSTWRAILRGESTLNAGLATVALPAFADVVASADATFAWELRTFAKAQAEALRKCWTGKWVHRGYLGMEDLTLGEDRIFLDTQGFGAIGNVWTKEQCAELFKNVQELCVDPEPAGARCLWPAMEGRFLEPGMDTNGGTWSAVDAWTAYAWSLHDPKPAWDYFLRASMAKHAEAYPTIWYGIWSGPDSFNASYHKDAGRTFNINLTPMTDFPVMNMNRHAGTLNTALRVGGLRPEGGRIRFTPHVPLDDFALKTPLIGGVWIAGKHRGYYTPLYKGTFKFAVAAPANAFLLKINGEERELTRDEEGLVCFEADGAPGKRIEWEIE